MAARLALSHASTTGGVQARVTAIKILHAIAGRRWAYGKSQKAIILATTFELFTCLSAINQVDNSGSFSAGQRKWDRIVSSVFSFTWLDTATTRQEKKVGFWPWFGYSEGMLVTWAHIKTNFLQVVVVACTPGACSVHCVHLTEAKSSWAKQINQKRKWLL